MILGFDIGGTKCAVLIGMPVQGTIQIIDKTVLGTNLPAYEMIEKLFITAEGLLARYSSIHGKLSGIGISCGGPLSSKKGLILSPPNLIGWDEIPIVKMARDRFQVSAHLQNDANACAMAEWRYGAGQGVDNLIFLTFGTGMGAGLILNGKLYPGISDLAGEVGHLRIGDHSGPVGFGKAGSFEGYCSGGGIAQLGQLKARERLQTGRSVAYCRTIQDLGSVTAKSIAEAAFDGDDTAIEVYRICGEFLGKTLAWFIDLLNPELILLGSIYSRAQALLEPSMMKMIRSEALEASAGDCRIKPAGLGESIGDMAALSLAAIIEK